MCCSGGRKESDTTERLNSNNQSGYSLKATTPWAGTSPQPVPGVEPLIEVDYRPILWPPDVKN